MGMFVRMGNDSLFFGQGKTIYFALNENSLPRFALLRRRVLFSCDVDLLTLPSALTSGHDQRTANARQCPWSHMFSSWFVVSAPFASFRVKHVPLRDALEVSRPGDSTKPSPSVDDRCSSIPVAETQPTHRHTLPLY